MSNIFTARSVRALTGGLLLLSASLAHAQYVWIDEKGLKQFSDRPPPTSTPLNKILKAPGQAAPELPGADGAAPAAPAAAKKAEPPTMADRNADYKKRAKEQADAAAKSAEEEKFKLAKKENCEVARNQKRELLSGERFTTTDKNGERGFLSDEQRAERVAKANKVLDDCN
jgi:hypothetical protein